MMQPLFFSLYATFALLSSVSAHNIVANSSTYTIANPPTNFHLDIDGMSVGASLMHICALERKHGAEMGGKVVCWGNNKKGVKAPKDVRNFYSVNLEYYLKKLYCALLCFYAMLQGLFVQVVSSADASCALNVDQTVVCWGGYPAPLSPQGLFTQITASEFQFCGVLVDGSISCFGAFASFVVYSESLMV